MGKQPLAVNRLEFFALFLSQNKHIALRTDVHVDPRSLELVGLVGAEHFDLQTGIEFPNVTNGYPHVIYGFTIAFECSLEGPRGQEFNGVTLCLCPLLGKLAIPLPVIIDGLLGGSGKPSCERRRIGQRKSRQEFRSPYKGVTRARSRVSVIRVKPIISSSARAREIRGDRDNDLTQGMLSKATYLETSYHL